MTLGEKIKALRTESKISLSELEEKCGLSKGYLSQLERSECKNPSVDAMRRLAEALGADPTYLMGDDPNDDSGTPYLPVGLRELVEEREKQNDPVPQEDVQMLLGIKLRGRRPKTSEDWAYLYETIKRVIK